jgi:AmiR/NasT family two-component response regulator
VLDADGLSPRLGRSILDMVRAQSGRLQTMSDELNTARGALHERKVIERAKGLLMAHRGLTEDQAYRMLRQTAMDQKRRLVDVAEATLALADMLPAGPADKDRRNRG